MKKIISYRQKLISLAKIYKIDKALDTNLKLTTYEIELELLRNKVPIPSRRGYFSLRIINEIINHFYNSVKENLNINIGKFTNPFNNFFKKYLTINFNIIKSLKKGGDFKELAKVNSIDKESKNNGGNLGWFSADDMVESFSNAIKKMVVNEVTDYPVQSQFGWHIIQLNEIKPSLPPSLDEKIDDIKLILQKSKLKKYLDELRLTADIKK